jgi:hypothetical protein
MHRQDDKNTRGRRKGFFSQRFKEMVFSAIPTNGSSFKGRFCQDFVEQRTENAADFFS